MRALAEGSDVDADELYRQTGGNPFFVTEVLAAGGTGVPASVRDAVLARAARLDVSARSASSTRRPSSACEADLALLEEICGESPRGLDECLAAGVLQSLDRQSRLPARARAESDRRGDRSSRGEPSCHVACSGRAERAPATRLALAHHAEAAGDAAAVLEHARAARRACRRARRPPRGSRAVRALPPVRGRAAVGGDRRAARAPLARMLAHASGR